MVGFEEGYEFFRKNASGFVGADNIATTESLNCAEFFYNCILFCQPIKS